MKKTGKTWRAKLLVWLSLRWKYYPAEACLWLTGKQGDWFERLARKCRILRICRRIENSEYTG